MGVVMALMIIIVPYGATVTQTSMTTCLDAKKQISGLTVNIYCVEIKP